MKGVVVKERGLCLINIPSPYSKAITPASFTGAGVLKFHCTQTSCFMRSNGSFLMPLSAIALL